MLKLFYAKKEDIPAGYESLYTEKDGQWILTGVEGLKTQKDVDAVSEALRKERSDHAAVKTKLAAWGDRDVTATLAELDKIEEYKLAAEGKLDEAKIETIVQSRLNQVKGPLERTIETLKGEKSALTSENNTLKAESKSRIKKDAIRSAALEAKVRPEAIDDILLIGEHLMELTDDGRVITRDGVGVTAGLAPKDFFQDAQSKRPYWWPNSQGDGAGGSGGTGGFAKNPWSKDHWNLTEQGAAVRANPAEAERMAAAANSRIGATQPTIAAK